MGNAADRPSRLYDRPLCFTPAQWVSWRNGPGVPNPIDYACQDCSPDYKARMMRVHRCSWPCVEFFIMPDGTMEGRRMSIPLSRGYAEGRRIIEIRVEGARTVETDCSMGQDPALESTSPTP